MQVGLWGPEYQYVQNKIFFNENDKSGAKNNLKFIYLKKFLKEKNIFFDTLDTINDLDKIDFLIFVDYPLKYSSRKSLHAFQSKIPKILVTDENKFIRPPVWEKKNLDQFNFVMSIDDDFVDNIKFFEYSVADHVKDFNLNFKIQDVDFDKKKLISWITWNKASFSKQINFSLRKKIINWYENNHPSEFDLYGPNWDELSFPYSSIFEYLNNHRFAYIRKLLGKKYKIWKGRVDNKIEINKDYKFCFAFENTSSLNGYITEKIFDVFYAGSVPVYFGAKNIEEHIPKNCYIDFRDFANFGDMHNFLKSFKKNNYLAMQTNIKNFLFSEKSYKFTAKFFCEKIFELMKGYL